MNRLLFLLLFVSSFTLPTLAQSPVPRPSEHPSKYRLAQKNAAQAIGSLRGTSVSFPTPLAAAVWASQQAQASGANRQDGILLRNGAGSEGGVLFDNVPTDGDEIGDACMTTQGLSCYTTLSYYPCVPKPPKPTTKADGCTDFPGATKDCPPQGPPFGGGGGSHVGSTSAHAAPSGGMVSFSPVVGGGTGGGGPFGGADGQPCDCIYCALVFPISHSLSLNSGQPQSGKVIISSDPADSTFPLPYQTASQKVRIKARYLFDFLTAFTWDLDGCNFSTQPDPPDFSNQFLAAYCAISFRVTDPPDPSVYAYNPSADDNLDPNRKKGNILLVGGYPEAPNSCTKQDSQGNTWQVSVLPQVVGTAPSIFWPGVSAYVMEAEIDLEVTGQYAGDNYTVEVGTGLVRDLSGNCSFEIMGPAVCGDSNCFPYQGYCNTYSFDCSTYENFKKIGPFTAWKRGYSHSLVTHRFGAELSQDFLPDSDSAPDSVRVFWEQYAGAVAVNDSVRIMDFANPVGEVAIVLSVGTLDPATNTLTVQLDRDLVGSYKCGYPGDPRFSVAGGRGATLIKLASGLGTNEDVLVNVAFGDGFLEVSPIDQTTNLPPFNIFPLDGIYPFDDGEPEAMIKARIDLWGWTGGGDYFSIINGSCIRPESTLLLSGLASPVENWAFVSASYWEIFSASSKVERQREVTAHEVVHLFHEGVPFSVADCTHSSNFLDANTCLMNNHSSAATSPDWADGSVRMFQESGTDTHHYYWIRTHPVPF